MIKVFLFLKELGRVKLVLTDMTSLQEQIVEKFLAELAESTDVDINKIEQLKRLLNDEKKLKPDDLVRIFSLPLGEPIK